MRSNLLVQSRKFLLLASIIALCSTNTTEAQTGIPISLTGFNADVIADAVTNTAIATVTNNSIDPGAPGHVFFAQGYSINATPYPNGLPDNGQMTSTAGHLFQLAAYTGNNDLRLAPTQSGTLTFSAGNQTRYTYLYVIGNAGGGLTQVNYTIHFFDGSTSSGSWNIPDWYCTSCTQYAINGLDRASLADGSNDGSPGFVIYEQAITLSGAQTNKQITSIDFAVPSNQVGIANIFGVTGITTLSLPVILENYTVTQDKGNALIQWKTAQELNSSAYLIQRANSVDPNNFVQVGTVEATSSQLGSSYSFVDNPGVAGTFFYRLVEQDIDGRTQVLGIKSITLNSNSTWAVQDLGNQWKLVCPQPFKYRLIDMQGRVLGGATGSGNVLITKPEAAGIYELQVQTNGYFSAQKLIK